MKRCLEARCQPNFRLSVKKTAATALLTALLLVQVPSGTIWRSIDLLAIAQREEVNLVGYLAASLVLATFCMRSMGTLRLVALASNAAFIAYGYLANLTPVLLLHAVLLPVNAYRLMQICGLELHSRHQRVQ
jgi:hypothetical protein